jgi:uncharacterized membrane protein YphA (DoxX/SURF4 family)
MRYLKSGWKAWNRFWFETEAEPQLAIFRRMLGTTLFLLYLIRTFDLELFFSENGIAPALVFKDILKTKFSFTFLEFVSSPTLLWSAHILFLASLLALAMGLLPRVASWVAFILHLSFLQRNMSVAYGVDFIATYFLFYLSISTIRGLASVGFRLSQIQVCIIYGYSGLEKLMGSHWWRGDALWEILANSQSATWNFGWTAELPVFIVIGTYATLAWEIYFPALIWIGRLRPWVLLFGVLMHLGIAITINIPFFSFLMISSYSLFVDAALSEKIRSTFRKPFSLTKVHT